MYSMYVSLCTSVCIGYSLNTHETQRDEGLLTHANGQEMVDLAKLNEIAKAVFVLKSQ